MKFASIIAAAFVGTALLASAANATSLGCQNGTCANQTNSGKAISLHLTSQVGATHFNIRNSCQGNNQVELGADGRYAVTLGVDSPARCQISAQACRRGGNVGPIQGRSSCTSWASWSVANPANDVVGGHHVCKNGFCADITNHTSNNITIKLTKWPASSNRNLRSSDGRQIEGDQGTFRGNSVGVQACNKGFLGKSSCSAWVNFK